MTSPMMASDVLSSMLCYTLFSSVMLVANKVAISLVPAPACVFLVQIAAAPVLILICKRLGWLQVDDFDLPKLRAFAPYACSFVLSIYCNGKALQYSNVETVITFRACSPLCVCLLDCLFLGREAPSCRSVAALAGVVAGALGYVCSDSEFNLRGLQAYGWVSIYLVCNVFEMTYGKAILSRVDFSSPVWGSVLYTKTLAFAPMAALAYASGEMQGLGNLSIDAWGVVAVLFCSIAGVGISWSGWNCREKVSATTYSLLGVACKVLSVILNVAIWDKHATPVGIAWLLMCLLCSSLYQQAPLRTGAHAAAQKAQTPAAASRSSNADRLFGGRWGAEEEDIEDGDGSVFKLEAGMAKN